MSGREQVKTMITSVAGVERARRLGRMERRVRTGVADTLARWSGAARPGANRPAPAASKAAPPAAGVRWLPSDPFADFPTPTASRHDVLTYLHEALRPRTYLEVGVSDGQSLALSRARSIGVDPAFKIDREIWCDVQLVRLESDAFFARADATRFFDSTPVDLAFIDGMHLAEYALRDFMNVERLMSPAGVIVLDDMLPRNPLEAARKRRTHLWAGDVYKLLVILREQRPDLVVIPVNSAPTGVVIVAGLDPKSTVLDRNYDRNLELCTAADPQDVPSWILHREGALPADRLRSDAWADLVAQRDNPEAAAIAEIVARLPRG